MQRAEAKRQKQLSVILLVKHGIGQKHLKELQKDSIRLAKRALDYKGAHLEDKIS